MTWTYIQQNGRLYGPTGKLVGIGYSGRGAGLNNPAADMIHRVGPIPCGTYTIGAPLDPPDHLGPLAMPLTPGAGNVMFGRSGFYVHGDNAALNHTASDGCVILPRGFRQMIADSEDRALRVVATDVKGTK